MSTLITIVSRENQFIFPTGESILKRSVSNFPAVEAVWQFLPFKEKFQQMISKVFIKVSRVKISWGISNNVNEFIYKLPCTGLVTTVALSSNVSLLISKNIPLGKSMGYAFGGPMRILAKLQQNKIILLQNSIFLLKVFHLSIWFSEDDKIITKMLQFHFDGWKY